jgi:Calcium-dependent channel, 7TM region, putative phosphate
LTDNVLLSISPVVLLFVNYILIPCVIDYSSYYLSFRLKSERHYSNFWKHYIYLLINVLIIPLFGLTNYESLIYYLTSNDSFTITNRAMTKSTLFTKFMLGLTLMSNVLYALDAPHWFYKCLHERHKSKLPEYMKLSPHVLEVGYYFDHGYNLAFVALIWTMAILFSTIAPLIPVIAFVFFLIKYLVDKYNFMYVYPAEFDSQKPFGIKVSYICTASVFGF